MHTIKSIVTVRKFSFREREYKEQIKPGCRIQPFFPCSVSPARDYLLYRATQAKITDEQSRGGIAACYFVDSMIRGNSDGLNWLVTHSGNSGINQD